MSEPVADYNLKKISPFEIDICLKARKSYHQFYQDMSINILNVADKLEDQKEV
jgi:hypothetical protein